MNHMLLLAALMTFVFALVIAIWAGVKSLLWPLIPAVAMGVVAAGLVVENTTR